MKKVLFISNIPTPYRNDFFNELGQSVDLTVIFEAMGAGNQGIRFNWSADQIKYYKAIFLKKGDIEEKKVNTRVFQYLKGKYDYVFVTNYSYMTEIVALLYLKLHRIPYILEVDGGTIRDESKLKKAIKMFLISGAQNYFSPSKETDKFLIHYGAKKDRIRRYPFTSLTEQEIDLRPRTLSETNEIRNELRISEEQVVISVGRFSHMNGYGKGYDVLLRAAQKMPSNIGWYIIGGKPTEEFSQKTQSAGLHNVHYVDFKSRDELKQYYRAADIFVLMTIGDVWGLVVNEAMACGLPIVTTDKCIAGLELVSDDRNGYIISVGDDVALTQKLKKMLRDPEEMLHFGSESIERIRKYTIEEMAKIHVCELKESV